MTVAELVRHPEFRRGARVHGAGLVSLFDSGSISAQIAGDGVSAAYRLLPRAEVNATVIEFGTKPPMDVLQALRAENYLHFHGDRASPQGVAIAKQIRDVFHGDAPDWKGMALGQSLVACRQMIAGLNL